MAIFSGTMMDDILRGTMEDDVLWGGMGDDDLQGRGGNDRLIGGPGADTLNGGPGMDIASYTDSPRGVHVDMSTTFVDTEDMKAPIRGGDAEGDALSSIEIIWGSDFSDVLIGTHSHNQLFGNGGSDELMGKGGNDLLRGGDDDDSLMGGPGMDTLYGDMGVDSLMGDAGNDLLRGGMDEDILEGGAGHDTLEGGPGGDDLDGGPETDTAAYTMSSAAVTVDLRHPIAGVTKAPMGGDAEGDTLMNIENLRGSMYDDVLIGDNPMPDPDDDTKMVGGKNKLLGDMGDDMLKGMGGDDTLHGGKGMDTLYGGAGADKLMGEMGDDALKGGDGMDTLMGGAGADKLFGGTVNEDGEPEADGSKDTADYSMSDMGVRVNLGAFGGATAEGGHAEGDALHDIQSVTGSAHTDYLVGDKNDNTLMGMSGDDKDDPATRGIDGGLRGMGGNDLLIGGAGMDELDGGAGMDDLWGGGGDDMLKGGAGNDAPFYIATKAAVSDTDGNVVTPAQTKNAMAMGLSVSDLFEPTPTAAAAALKDMNIQRAGLFGGAGDDTLEGGTGLDYIHGGSGNDTATYAGSAQAVAVNIGTAYNFNAPTVTDDDTTTRDERYTYAGELPGAEGANGVTVTDGDAGAEITQPEANTDDPNAVNQEQLVSIENLIGSSMGDTLVGSSGPNTLSGGKGGDTLYGREGDDVLTGGEGADTLTGGAGADTFVFGPQHAADSIAADGSVATDSDDQIEDFRPSEGDQIDLTAFGLNPGQLRMLLGQDTDAADGVTLNLNALEGVSGGGVIQVSIDDQFTALTVGDFIID